MSDDKTVYYTPEVLALAYRLTMMSPSTWRKIMNPLCPRCLIERYSSAEKSNR